MPRTKGITKQHILTVFDAAEGPFLSVGEVAEEVGVSAEAVRYHLEYMVEEGQVGRKSIGSRAVGYWARVAPRLDPDVEAELEEPREGAWDDAEALDGLEK